MRSPNRVIAVVIGLAYVSVGVAAFFVTPGIDFFDTTGVLLFGVLSVNPALGVVHILLGAALVLGGILGVRAAKAVNGFGGAVFLALGIAGLFIAGTDAALLAIDGAGNVLHFGTSVVLLAVGLGAERKSG